METQEFGESPYITAALINESKEPVGVVIDEAMPIKTDYGQKLACKVSFDKKIKEWRMNRDSVKNMQKISTDSKNWVGHKVRFIVVPVNNKERIIGMPIIENGGGRNV